MTSKNYYLIYINKILNNFFKTYPLREFNIPQSYNTKRKHVQSGRGGAVFPSTTPYLRPHDYFL